MIRDAFLGEFDYETATTRRVLERLPEDRWTWKPHEKSMAVDGLASHVAHLPVWLYLTLTTDELDLAGMPPNTAAASPAEVLERFDHNVAQARGALQAADDATMLAPWTLRMGERVMFTMPRVQVIRGFVMNHHIHHRGQLSVYLRMLNVPVPSIYGPSADENAM